VQLPLNVLAKSLISHPFLHLTQAKVAKEKSVHWSTGDTNIKGETIHFACGIVTDSP
jgi:hypothetical protein